MISEIQAQINKQNTDIKVDIRSRSQSFFKGSVRTLTSINDKGEFDVLPMHANFVTLIRDYIILDKGTEKEQKIEIETAVLSVLGDKVDVYVGF